MSEDKRLPGLRAQVARHGYTIMSIAAREDEEGPDWCYTIGLEQTYAHPELVVVGLSRENATYFLTQACALIKGGQAFSPADRATGIMTDGYVCGFRAVPPEVHPVCLGIGANYYGGSRKFRSLQLFVSDRNNRLPWDPGVDPACARGQVDLATVAAAATRGWAKS